MDKATVKRALRQYIRYFRVWFIVLGIMAAVSLVYILIEEEAQSVPRINTMAAEERVYDYADVLTDREENALRRQIAKYEKKCCIDIVIVTLDEPMGISDSDWEWNMMNYADDFYDNGWYGWNRIHGNGALLLDNWYEDENGSQKGSWLSTSGSVEWKIGAREEGEILDAMYTYIDKNPYKAYRAAVKRLASVAGDSKAFDLKEYLENDKESCLAILIIPFVIALIYAWVHLNPSKGVNTTVASTYVKGGVPVLRSSSDSYIRKNVVSYQIRSDDDNNSNSTRSVSNTGGSSFGSMRSSNHNSSNHSSSSSSRSTGSSNRSSVSSNTRGGGSYGHHVSGGRSTGSSGGSGSAARSTGSSVRSGSSGGKSGGSGGGYSHGGGGRRR